MNSQLTSTARAEPRYDPAVVEPIVEFKKVEKTYDGFSNVVNGIDLTIGRGEFVTLLGPSGSGKTTLLMMLAGFENPTGGDIMLNGILMNRVAAYKRNMGVVFQSYALFPHMSVRQNVAYPLARRNFSKSEQDRKVMEALAMVHMEAFADRYPAQLSGGQQQRIALARALVFKPDVVLMDEPLGALDKKLREHMQIEIKKLHDMLGMTVVYVTHDQSEALTMSNRVAVFNQGTILQIGTPQEIYEHPNCSFVANFIGEVNNFAGRVETTDGAYCSVQLDCGSTAGGLNVIGAKAGDRVNVAVRPERIELAHTVSATKGAACGKVAAQVYYGDHLRYELEVPNTPGVTVKTSLDPSAQFAAGSLVNLTWARQNARVLDVA